MKQFIYALVLLAVALTAQAFNATSSVQGTQSVGIDRFTYIDLLLDEVQANNVTITASVVGGCTFLPSNGTSYTAGFIAGSRRLRIYIKNTPVSVTNGCNVSYTGTVGAMETDQIGFAARPYSHRAVNLKTGQISEPLLVCVFGLPGPITLRFFVPSDSLTVWSYYQQQDVHDVTITPPQTCHYFRTQAGLVPSTDPQRYAFNVTSYPPGFGDEWYAENFQSNTFTVSSRTWTLKPTALEVYSNSEYPSSPLVVLSEGIYDIDANGNPTTLLNNDVAVTAAVSNGNSNATFPAENDQGEMTLNLNTQYGMAVVNTLSTFDTAVYFTKSPDNVISADIPTLSVTIINPSYTFHQPTWGDLRTQTTYHMSIKTSLVRVNTWTVFASFASGGCTCEPAEFCSAAGFSWAPGDTGVAIAFSCDNPGQNSFQLRVPHPEAVGFGASTFTQSFFMDSSAAVTSTLVDSYYTLTLPHAVLANYTLIPVCDRYTFEPNELVFTPETGYYLQTKVTPTYEAYKNGISCTPEFIERGPDSTRFSPPAAATFTPPSLSLKHFFYIEQNTANSAVIYPGGGQRVVFYLDDFVTGFDSVTYLITHSAGLTVSVTQFTLSSSNNRIEVNVTSSAACIGSSLSLTLKPSGPGAELYQEKVVTFSIQYLNLQLRRVDPLWNEDVPDKTILLYNKPTFFNISLPYQFFLQPGPASNDNVKEWENAEAITVTLSNPNLAFRPSTFKFQIPYFSQTVAVVGMAPGDHTINVDFGVDNYRCQVDNSEVSFTLKSRSYFATLDEANAILGSAVNVKVSVMALVMATLSVLMMTLQ